jgi:hypothetical protein
MTGNSVVDIAIGLIFMYLVLSLVCTAVNEYIATLLKLRAKSLAGGIQQLIDDPVLHQLFSNHGLVDSTKRTTGGAGPSYIDGRSFAMALLASVDPTKPVPVFEDVQQALQHLRDSNIRDMLLAQVATSGGDIQKLRDGVASWFDSAMDRVTGVYKRWLKAISFGVGLVVAIAINADTVSVAKALWHDPTARVQIAGIAEHAQVPPPNIDAAQALSDLKTLRGLPIGWPLSLEEYNPEKTPLWAVIPAKVLGLLLTAVALSLGAPFWFDLLSKFMNVRGSGARPDPVAPTN